MSRHFKIDDVLEEKDLASFQAEVREKKNTIDDLMVWLAEHGYRISRGAVHNYRTNFNEVLEGVRRSSEMASAFVDMARKCGGAELAGASLSRFQQLLMEKLMQISGDEELDAGELMKLSIALKTAVGAQQGIEELKAEYEAKQKKAVAAGEAAARSGGDPVEAIKKALGLAA